MSRVGKMPIAVPKGVTVTIEGGLFQVEGPKGKLVQKLFPEVPVKFEDGTITITRVGEVGPIRAKHGLTRALLRNAVVGVTDGFSKQLEIVGVGYKGEIRGREAHFALGYSHPVVFPIPDGIEIEIDKANKIGIKGADRQVVGQVAAEIRSLRPPDPYKAKGIRYSNEVIRRKEGKAGGKGGKK
jgi:large subunit ribosomal protein L6